ncbi:MAG TPA: caspase family protein [Terriglobales bacterium]|nr:caspase family protein [Terriglobales bacterium]
MPEKTIPFPPSKGYSLHIGLNRVDPAHYNGWSGQLNACEKDALDMEAIAKAQGYQTQKLLTAQATAANVITTIKKVASLAKPTDTFLLTYSGHGGQINDAADDEPDGLDETWVLYDRQLIDDELFQLWCSFRPGVRIFSLSDSCHSGTVTKAMFQTPREMLPKFEEKTRMAKDTSTKIKAMPPDVQFETYQKNKKMYDDIRLTLGPFRRINPACSVILISGCQDNQTSMDGPVNGAFTGALLKVWSNGTFVGSHPHFRKDIAALLPPTQSPNYYVVGSSNVLFEMQRPFTVMAPHFAAVGKAA